MCDVTAGVMGEEVRLTAVDEKYQRQVEAGLEEFETSVVRLTRSARETFLTTIREDERLRESVRRALIAAGSGRGAAHRAASIVLADEEAGLRDVAAIAAAAAKVSAKANPPRARKLKSVEGVERGARKVIRAELAIARRLAEAREKLWTGARDEIREAVREATFALAGPNRTPPRPHALDALLSGDTAEIDAAFQVLLGPAILYARHYGNLLEMIPRVLLVLVGAAVLFPQHLSMRSADCKDVLNIGGIGFLPLSGWLAAQIFCDTLILALRLHAVVALYPIVSTFGRGRGAEASEATAKRRAQLFNAYTDDIEPPHILEALLPLDAANERGERALLALARISSPWRTKPLAVLTVLSFALGFAGGIWLLLPFRRDNCQPGLLLVANAYVAFFYIFFIPNTLIVAVALADLSNKNLGFVEAACHKLDDSLFNGLPVFSFLKDHFLLGTTISPVTDPAVFKRMLQRDADFLETRRERIRDHLDTCDAQLATARALLADDHPAPGRIHRYTQLLPELAWRKTLVPVYDSYPPLFPEDPLSRRARPS